MGQRLSPPSRPAAMRFRACRARSARWRATCRRPRDRLAQPPALPARLCGARRDDGRHARGDLGGAAAARGLDAAEDRAPRCATKGVVQLRSLYIEPAAAARMPRDCEVLEVTPLLRELILRATELPLEYEERGPAGRADAPAARRARRACRACPITCRCRRPRRSRAICRAAAGQRRTTPATLEELARADGTQRAHARAAFPPPDRHELRRMAAARAPAARARLDRRRPARSSRWRSSSATTARRPSAPCSGASSARRRRISAATHER